MKKITTTLLAVLSAILLFAQSPHAFKYQAVARDASGIILSDQEVTFRISILEGSPSGIIVYAETHDTITNFQGLVNLKIGNGTVVSGVFEDIDWGNGPFYLQIEMDDSGGDAYELLGVSQILSVPTAMHARTADISKGLILTDQYGQEHTLSLDPEGNIVADLILECGDTIIDIRDGQQYITVLIGSQCWLAENLNIGRRIDGIDNQMDNDTIEKYCYDDLESNCDTYGGLYQWGETMQYTTIKGSQGICPTGWHIPTDYELKVLEGTVDSKYGIGDPLWNNNFDFRGLDAGLNFKSTSGWASGGNGTDLFNFKALPGGSGELGLFDYISEVTVFWSSSLVDPSDPWIRGLFYDSEGVIRYPSIENDGYSIRCLKDYTNLPPTQPANPVPEDGAIDIGIDTVLSWSCSDPDGNDLFYKIHFGTDPNPSYDTAGITDTIYYQGILDYNTTYYWKVVVFDSYGDSAVSDIWTFTTRTESFLCGDVLIDARDGKSYNTVLIGTQCWMAENINIGTRINGTEEQTQNSPTEIFEKYCFDDLETNCDTYGGLYQWDEMMQYVTNEGTQGICPIGWHIPTDAEWCTLENEVDAGTISCSTTEWRGTDAGGNLKETGTTHWATPNLAYNTSGFTGLPGGYRFTDGSFGYATTHALFWSSSEDVINAWDRRFLHWDDQVGRYSDDQAFGFSVRCLMD